MEAWLDATDAMPEVEAINAANPHQTLYAVPGPSGRLLVRSVLLSDPDWSEWHEVLRSMPSTEEQPVSPAP
jgi:hypothetical protein